MQWYKPKSKHKIGILFSRTLWANGDLEIINTLVREFEKEFDVIPAFCYGMGDKELGAKPSGEVIEEFFFCPVKLDVLVFHPLMAHYKTEEEWRRDSQGICNLEVGWSVAMPEFEGVSDLRTV